MWRRFACPSGASALDLARFEVHYVHMTYVTIEAEIADGRVVPTVGAQLPERGRAVVTLLPDTAYRTNWDAVIDALASEGMET